MQEPWQIACRFAAQGETLVIERPDTTHGDHTAAIRASLSVIGTSRNGKQRKTSFRFPRAARPGCWTDGELHTPSEAAAWQQLVGMRTLAKARAK
jgi:hypothetical protein